MIEKRKEAAKKLWDEGYRFEVIAEKLLLNTQTVRSYLRGPDKRENRGKVTKEDLPEIVERRKRGASLNEIGISYGVSRERIRQIINEHNKEIAADLKKQKKKASEVLLKQRIFTIKQLGKTHTRVEIAKKLGLSEGFVSRLIYTHGLKVRDPEPVLKENTKKVLALCDSTLTAGEIADKLGITRISVLNIASNYRKKLKDGRSGKSNRKYTPKKR